MQPQATTAPKLTRFRTYRLQKYSPPFAYEYRTAFAKSWGVPIVSSTLSSSIGRGIRASSRKPRRAAQPTLCRRRGTSRSTRPSAHPCAPGSCTRMRGILQPLVSLPGRRHGRHRHHGRARLAVAGRQPAIRRQPAMAREVVDIYGNHQLERRFRPYSADGEQASVGLVASKQERHGRKRHNGALLQGQLFKKRRVAHGKEGSVRLSV